jgi:hypothetical protein
MTATNIPRIRWRLTPGTFLMLYSWRDWFFRIHNYGLSSCPLEGHWQPFSERYGYVKVWHGLGQCWTVLKP